MISVFLFIFLSYGVLIVSLAIGVTKVAHFRAPNSQAKNTFSVVIPFRNEAKHLGPLLQSIQEISYPKELMEFLFVDDASTDSSAAIITKFCLEHNSETDKHLHLLKNHRASNSPKKDAISTAIGQAKNDWIMTTDADCLLPINWIKIMDHFIQTQQPKMVVAPVNYSVEAGFLSRFQALDFLSLQASTMGGFGIKKPFLSNGANLTYEKASFLQVNGFEENNHIASGDDLFIFEKFMRLDPSCVQFLKSKQAIVTTLPVNTTKELIHQRVRWAAKAGNSNLWFSKFVGLLVFATNLLVVAAFFLCLFQQLSVLHLAGLFVFKGCIDLILVSKSLAFFKQKKLLSAYFISSLCYPFFTVFIVLTSWVSNYQWKGRAFKK
jgi:cellulose synthase/poly-beta-1,6-N-acetylglucosamine synthase-like glycosyltransferase